MNCYYHPSQPAIGLCKQCQRGLCIACTADVDDSLACKDRHEEQVRALDALAAHNLLQAGRVGSVYRRNAIFSTSRMLKRYPKKGVRSGRTPAPHPFFRTSTSNFAIY